MSNGKVGRVAFKTECIVTPQGHRYFRLYRRGWFFWHFLCTFEHARDAWNMVDEILLGEGKRVIMFEHTRLVRDGLTATEVRHDVEVHDDAT